MGPTQGCLKELAAGPEQGRGHRSVRPSAWWPAPCSHGFTWVRAVRSQGRQGRRGSQTRKPRFTSPGGPGGSCFSAATQQRWQSQTWGSQFPQQWVFGMDRPPAPCLGGRRLDDRDLRTPESPTPAPVCMFTPNPRQGLSLRTFPCYFLLSALLPTCPTLGNSSGVSCVSLCTSFCLQSM